MMKTTCKFATLCFFAAVTTLFGCASFYQPPVFEKIPWSMRQEKINQIKTWDVNGSLSIIHNKRIDFAHFRWVQDNGNYTIHISGPMNLNSVVIEGSAANVQFCKSSDKCISAKKPEQLVFNQLGWRIPVSSMGKWILSLPAKGRIESTALDQYGHLIQLCQQGWTVDYSEFQKVKDIDLPGIITIKNNKITIKFKVIMYNI